MDIIHVYGLEFLICSAHHNVLEVIKKLIG